MAGDVLEHDCRCGGLGHLHFSHGVAGVTYIEAGPFSESWRYQPGRAAYCSDPTIEQLPLLLERAADESFSRQAGQNDQSSSEMMGYEHRIKTSTVGGLYDKHEGPH